MTLTGPYNLNTTRELLATLSHSPNKRLGQNFLVDGNIVRKSLELAEIRAGDVVVEVGPGLGTLTTTLLQAGARVFAVERDATLAAHLRERVAPAWRETFDLKEADAMDFPLAGFPEKMPAETPFKIVANLPYAISTPWMDAVLEGARLPETLVLMLQKEAAERFSAGPGTKNFGALSVFLDAAYERASGHGVPASCFFPPPKVDSYLLRLRRRERPFVFGKNVRKLIRGIFIYRRKQLGAALKKALADGEFSSRESAREGAAENLPEISRERVRGSFEEAAREGDGFSSGKNSRENLSGNFVENVAEKLRENSSGNFVEKSGGISSEKISAWLASLPQFGVSAETRPECVPVAAWRALAEICAPAV